MLFNYIKDKFKIIVLLLVFSTVFTVVFFLYSLPVSSVMYATVLCLLILVIVFMYDYFVYFKKHRKLLRLKGSIVNSINDLPMTNNSLEKYYTELLIEFEKDYKKLQHETEVSKTDMVDFYTLWVHQIKTPIAAMSVILQGEELPKTSQLLQELFKIERYSELVLGYLRIDNISSDLVLSWYNLDNIIKQAVKKYAPMFISKKIKLEMSGLNVQVLTDEKWLVFVIEQILSNALKYTMTGTIKIYTENETVLVIEDTGIGISQEDLPRVFENGFTGFNGRMDKKSTGLGLYLCKRIIDKLSHKINITSKKDAGTIVRIDLSCSKSINLTKM